ncbi:MAG: NADH-quinone oxidoreductase subunit N [Chloroflexota bacterium]|nr:NADH-quinone oxidoreductase subunit N [Chloroflexota bacterium]
MESFNLGASLGVIAPEIGLTIMAAVVLALDLQQQESRRKGIALVTFLGLLAIAVLYVVAWYPKTTDAPGLGVVEGMYWGGMLRHDTLAQLFKVIVLIAGALTALIASGASGVGRKGEFYLIIIVSSLGGTLLAGASDLIMVFLALETITIPMYILAAFRRDDHRSSESGMKYFLFGSFASAILLYGLSLLYGFTGQTNIYAIAEFLGSPSFSVNAVPTLAAMVLIVVGFGFKIGAAPFHFWTPDVYEGAPTPVTAFLSVASKAASFALIARFLVAVFPAGLIMNGQPIETFWVQLMSAMAVISMVLGNVVALAQRNIKRLLAYSSIAQAGYTLIGIASLSALGAEGQGATSVAAIGFYMFMYTFTNLLAFAVVIVFSEATGSENIYDLAGLSRRNPWLALTMTIALLSLAGVPPAAGFFGKFFLFQAAVEANLTWLALVGVINAIIALFYYLVVVKVMYVDHGKYEEQEIPVSRSYAWALGITTLAVLLLGTIGAQPIFDWASRGAAMLFAGM